MVKETKKIHIIDLVSKFFHCEKQDFNEKITDFLDEICGYFKLEWLEARSLIDHRIYRSKNCPAREDIGSSHDDETNTEKIILESLAELKFLSKSDIEVDREDLQEAVRLGLSVLIEKERNTLVYELTSEIRKSLRPDIALEKLYTRLKGYLDFNLFCFFLKNEDVEEEFNISFFERNENSELKINRKDSFSYNFISKLRELAETKAEKNIRVFESTLRNEKFGYLLIEKRSEWTQAQEDVLKLFVEQLAVIQNQHKLNDEVLSIVQREFLLNQVTTRVRDSLILPEIMDIASQEIGQIMGADSSALYLFNDSEVTNEAKQSIWSANESFNPVMENTIETCKNNLFQENSALSYCYQNFCPKQNIEPSIFNLHEKHSIKSFLASALMDQANKKVIGFIVLVACNSERDWSEKEEELLEALALQVSMALTQAAIYQDSQQTKRKMALLHKLSNDIRNSLDLHIVLSALAKGLGEVLEVDRCFVRMLSEDRTIIKTNEEYTSENITECADIIFGFEKRWISSLLSRSDLHQTTEVLNFYSLRDEFKHEAPPLQKITESLKIKSYLSVPLISHGKLLGTITVHQCDRERDYSLEEINFILQVGSEASVAIKNAELFDTIDTMSKTDPDTALYNKKYFNYIARKEIDNAKYKHRHISLMMVDLDYLKSINDTMGHEAGDEAILITANVLTQTLRQTPVNEIQRRVADVVGRYGGDEFIILLPNTDIESAYQAATRVRKNLAKYKHSTWKQPLTCSIGIAGTPCENYDFSQLKIKADQALYLSKKKGRNAISTTREL